MNLKSIYSLLVALFLISGVSANNNPKDSLTTTDNKPLRTYTTIRLSTAKPVIDGKLDDDCWKTGEWGGDFTQWIPKEGAKPSQETQIQNSV